MPRKKTRKDKIKTLERRVEQTQLTQVQFGESVLGSIGKVKSKKAPDKTENRVVTKSEGNFSLLPFPVELLTRDLQKSVILSGIILAIEVGLYLYLR